MTPPTDDLLEEFPNNVTYKEPKDMFLDEEQDVEDDLLEQRSRIPHWDSLREQYLDSHTPANPGPSIYNTPPIIDEVVDDFVEALCGHQELAFKSIGD